ncbi:CbtA family protein, partial [Streptomyces sp. NPDC005921]
MNSATVRNLLVRGMLAGLAAGVLALVVAYVLGEPNVDKAISFGSTTPIITTVATRVSPPVPSATSES